MTSTGEVPMSVCTHRQTQNEEYWHVMMENVERVSAYLSFSQDVSQSLFSKLSSAAFLPRIKFFCIHVFTTYHCHLQLVEYYVLVIQLNYTLLHLIISRAAS